MQNRSSTYVYHIQPTRPEMLSKGATAEEEAIIAAHFTYLEALMDQGNVMLAGRTLNTDPASFGIVILKAESESAARRIMLADPAVSHGIMQAKLFPFRIALCARTICTDER